MSDTDSPLLRPRRETPAPSAATAVSDLPDPLSLGVESRPGLLRALGLGTATALVVGNVIGSGIFAMPGGIARDLGSFPVIIATWIAGGAICTLGALCFAELAAMLPRAGGIYVYLREAYGRPVAFLSGWSDFAFGRPASVGALSVMFILAFGEAIGTKFSTFTGVALALGVIAAMAWVNAIGVIWGGRVQAATTLVKAGFLAAIALLPFVVTLAGGNGASAANLATRLPLPEEKTWAVQFAAAMLAVMWAYNGWHGATPVAEEIRNPGRNLPLSLFLGLGLIVLLYVAANCAYHSVLPMEEMAAANENVPQAMIRKLAGGPGSAWSALGVAAMSAVVMCSTLGAINSNMLNGPRVSFALGRDDLFFRGLGRVHAIYRTPVVAIAVQGVMSGLMVIGAAAYVTASDPAESAASRASEENQPGGAAGENRSADTGSAAGKESPENRDRAAALAGMSEVFKVLTSFIVFSASLFYMATVAAVIVLRIRRPEWERPYRTLGYPAVPLIYLVFYGWFLYHVFLGRPFEATAGLALTACGVPAYLAYRLWTRSHSENARDGV